MSEFNKGKFVFHEIFINESGKNSGSGFIGVLMGLIAIFSFIAGVVGWYLGLKDVMEFLEKVLQFGGLSALLMGVRKVVGIWGKKDTNEGKG